MNENEKLLYSIVDKYNLGKLLEQPTRVIGGLCHISYKLKTTTGCYFVKMIGKIDEDGKILEF